MLTFVIEIVCLVGAISYLFSEAGHVGDSPKKEHIFPDETDSLIKGSLKNCHTSKAKNQSWKNKILFPATWYNFFIFF